MESTPVNTLDRNKSQCEDCQTSFYTKMHLKGHKKYHCSNKDIEVKRKLKFEDAKTEESKRIRDLKGEELVKRLTAAKSNKVKSDVQTSDTTVKSRRKRGFISKEDWM